MSNLPSSNARDFFYCCVEDGRRYWGGYARFFEPCIPGRIGNVLVTAIYEALKGDEQARQKAIEIFSKSHTKNFHPREKGAVPYPVECFPTEQAKLAIEELNKLAIVPA